MFHLSMRISQVLLSVNHIIKIMYYCDLCDPYFDWGRSNVNYWWEYTKFHWNLKMNTPTSHVTFTKFLHPYEFLSGFPGGSMVKNLPAMPETNRFCQLVGEMPWRRKWQHTAIVLPGKFHGQRSLVGYSPWSDKRVRHDLVAKQQ